MMHGLTNLKICVAKQAKLIFQYKKIKIKLYKTNAAIWFQQNMQDQATNTKLHTNKEVFNFAEFI